jgi:hypothetical protein
MSSGGVALVNLINESPSSATVIDLFDNSSFWGDPAKMDSTVPIDLDVIDFGPDYDSPAVSGDEEKLGDWGFHPFLPIFTTTSAR